MRTQNYLKLSNALYTAFMLIVVLFYASGCASGEKSSANQGKQNTNQQDQSSSSDEWKVLFNGENMEHWRGYKKEASAPTGWEIKDGALYTSGGNGDIITKKQYDDFELVFDWKIEKGGNSGVMFHVVEGDDYGATYHTGPEYQLIDGENYDAGESGLAKNQLSGANYALHAPSSVPVKPAESGYNTSRLIVNDGHVEHWLNGEKVVSYDLGSAAWKKKVKNSKFNEMPGYGQYENGHIALQDHNHKIWFKNIKIKLI